MNPTHLRGNMNQSVAETREVNAAVYIWYTTDRHKQTDRHGAIFQGQVKSNTS